MFERNIPLLFVTTGAPISPGTKHLALGNPVVLGIGDIGAYVEVQ